MLELASPDYMIYGDCRNNDIGRLEKEDQSLFCWNLSVKNVQVSKRCSSGGNVAETIWIANTERTELIV